MSDEQNVEEEVKKLYAQIEQAVEECEGTDKYPFDANAIAESIDEQIAEKKQDIKDLRRIRRFIKPRWWNRFFG